MGMSTRMESFGWTIWQKQKGFFEDPAIEAVLNASDGVPRMISKLCNAALVIGNSQAASRIHAGINHHAVHQRQHFRLNLPTVHRPVRQPFFLKRLAASIS